MATNPEYGWELRGDLVGAYFLNHPKIHEANLIVEKPLHPMARFSGVFASMYFICSGEKMKDCSILQ